MVCRGLCEPLQLPDRRTVGGIASAGGGARRSDPEKSARDEPK